ncbi:MAG: ABC transporter substrate-binding protein [Clostridiales Family XIII bacterium]|jgi:NitT/TauT family transport system substrate-binding protein|nr:ABC transporter substrate-binding protein [Clostridiales Family XIII bacterium]
MERIEGNKRNKRELKRLIALLLVAAMALSLAACGGGSGSGSASETPAVSETEGGGAAADTAADTTAEAADYDWSIGRPLNISLVGDSCELHFYAAQYLGLFEEAGYEVNWILNGPSVDVKPLLASGKIDVTEGVLDGWLKPVEQGLDIRFSIGLEQGCMGTVVLADSPYQSIVDLKGKKIGGLGVVGSSIFAYLYRVILKEGLDPINDYEWLGLDTAAVLQALENGEAEAVVLPDSMSFAKVKSGEYRYITRMPDDESLRDQTCCFLMFSPQFAEEFPGATKKLTEILYEASVFVQDPQQKSDVVKYGFDEGLIIMGEYEDTLELVEPFRWEPGGQIAEDTFRDAFAAYQEAGIIDEGVDVEKFLDKAFLNYEEFYETDWVD